MTVSVGVASYPQDGATVAEVIPAANIAEHQAKSAGRNQVIAAHSQESGAA
jgi:GGDEF domain-containing protein